GHRFAGRGVADDDPADAVAHVVQRGGQRQHCHHLAGGGDVETGLPGGAVAARAEPGHDVTQIAFVDVGDAPPGDPVRIDTEPVRSVQVVVHHRREQVVCLRHGVHVTGEVQVHRFHRDDLAVAATR